MASERKNRWKTLELCVFRNIFFLVLIQENIIDSRKIMQNIMYNSFRVTIRLNYQRAKHILKAL